MTIVGIPAKKGRDARGWLIVTLFVVITFTHSILCFSQTGVVISDFEVSDWFRSVRVTWKANAPPDAAGDGIYGDIL